MSTSKPSDWTFQMATVDAQAAQHFKNFLRWSTECGVISSTQFIRLVYHFEQFFTSETASTADEDDSYYDDDASECSSTISNLQSHSAFRTSTRSPSFFTGSELASIPSEKADKSEQSEPDSSLTDAEKEANVRSYSVPEIKVPEHLSDPRAGPMTGPVKSVQSASLEHLLRSARLHRLARAMERPGTGVPVGKQRLLFKTHHNVFNAVEAIDWMMNNGVAQSREQAVELGKALAAKGHIAHVDGGLFEDGKEFFRFTKHPKPFVLTTPERIENALPLQSALLSLVYHVHENSVLEWLHKSDPSHIQLAYPAVVLWATRQDASMHRTVMMRMIERSKLSPSLRLAILAFARAANAIPVKTVTDDDSSVTAVGENYSVSQSNVNNMADTKDSDPPKNLETTETRVTEGATTGLEVRSSQSAFGTETDMDGKTVDNSPSSGNPRYRPIQAQASVMSLEVLLTPEEQATVNMLGDESAGPVTATPPVKYVTEYESSHRVMAHPFTDDICTIHMHKEFFSSAKPCWVKFHPVTEVDGNVAFDQDRTIAPDAILKTGDDVRKDLCVQLVFKACEAIWQSSKADWALGAAPQVPTTRVLPTSSSSGYIEFVHGRTIKEVAESGDWEKVNIQKLAPSIVGSMVSGFVLGVRDRHAENWLLLGDYDNPQLMAIDFAFMLMENPGGLPLDTPRLTMQPELIKLFRSHSGLIGKTLLDDLESDLSQAYRILRTHHPALVSFASVLLSSVYQEDEVESFMWGKHCFRSGQSEADAVKWFDNKLKSQLQERVWRREAKQAIVNAYYSVKSVIG